MNKSLQYNTLPVIHVFALAALGGGLSGGDRIFIELARYLSQKDPVVVYVWEEGLQMCLREKLRGSNLKIELIKVGGLSRLGFIFTYFYRILLGLKLGLTLKISNKDFVYSASEFWMDSLPALLIKIRKTKVRWIAAWFQTAPSPLRGFAEGKRKKLYRLSAFFYWFMQQPIKPLISRLADFVLVNNKIEKNQFPQLAKDNKAIVIGGAVNTEAISKYLKIHKPAKIKKYLAVFQGRFHPQKGVVELIDIWKLVTQKIPDARLAMIGDGPLMFDVINRIQEFGLNKNIDLFGYLHDGNRKYSIFNSSMIVLHPAFFDSGGMSSAEAMAFGLPCVGFDLKSYLSYYPEGMLKVPVGDISKFSETIIMLLQDKEQYYRLGNKAQKMIFKEYSWNNKAKDVLCSIGIKNEC